MGQALPVVVSHRLDRLWRWRFDGLGAWHVASVAAWLAHACGGLDQLPKLFLRCRELQESLLVVIV